MSVSAVRALRIIRTWRPGFVDRGIESLSPEPDAAIDTWLLLANARPDLLFVCRLPKR